MGLIARLVGMGRVFDGDDFIDHVPYEIRLYQNRSDGIVVSRRTACRLIGPPPIGDRSAKPYTLHLEDGRKLDFYMLSTGETEAAGGPY